MNLAYFDCFNGAGGDMLVGALIDAGADGRGLRDQLSALGLDGYSLSIQRVNKQGFAATRFSVRLTDDKPAPHRHLKDILAILDRAKLSATLKDRSRRIFERLAQAEATVHGIDIQQVHFHEVGAVDAILDVVGSVWALEKLGVDRICCSPLPVGGGVVECDHGVMPVPAPATAELLKGVPIESGGGLGELLTPTAAAVLTTLVDEFGPIPSMSIRSIGYGAGTRDGRNRPNVVRVLVGSTASSGDSGDTDEIAVLETNLDDISPELVGHCMERLLAEGALDVYSVPIQMKKSRSAALITVLCTRDRVMDMERLLFKETSTFGIRRHHTTRSKLRRRFETVQTRYGDIRMKVGTRDGLVTATPEFEDCRAVALARGVAVREVVTAAHAAWAMRSSG